LDVLIVGDMADGGGDFKVVVESDCVVTVLFVIESVLIVSSTGASSEIAEKGNSNTTQ